MSEENSDDKYTPVKQTTCGACQNQPKHCTVSCKEAGVVFTHAKTMHAAQGLGPYINLQCLQSQVSMLLIAVSEDPFLLWQGK